ncbi:MAG: chemotaxis protein CheW [Lachnospiraceae bacterium]|nr:chemotaxis protein CheW [Lachnospiraceae bacterium]MDD3660022.1 chemotaxis protein CheW [Lachnospiraceae bacterium]
MDEIKSVTENAQFIVIKIGQEQFGIDIQHIDNIVRMQNITRVPKVPEYFKGVINLRGEIIPVMSLRLKMGLEPDVITKATRIIIIKLEQHEGIGIIVDEVKEVVTLEKDQIEKMSYDKEEKKIFVYAVGKVEGALVSLLDLNAVLADA